MNDTDICFLERFFLGLGDKTRLRLLALVAAGPVSVGHLVESLGESQPKVSRHLAYMRQSGIVTTERDGKWIYYALAKPAQPAVRDLLASITSVVSDGTVRLYETPQSERNHPGGIETDDREKPHAMAKPYEYRDVQDIEDEEHVAHRREDLEVFLL